ncbi:MAG TPA: hypothetical protein VLA24_15175 [Pseudomonadales bacterium]|nr:hypothetical protein [Pseudomonadales bacterium]
MPVTISGSGAITGFDPVTSGFGKVLQVVSTTKSDTFTASLATEAIAPITGLSVSITPVSSTSKVLIMVNISAGSSGTDISPMFILERSGSPIAIGDSAGTRTRVTFGADLYVTTAGMQTVGITYLDSPATTSATTYSVDVMHSSATTQTVYVNRSQADNDLIRRGRAISTITAIEVAA